MIFEEYKTEYIEKKLLEARLESESLELQLFKSIASQYALEALLLHRELQKTLHLSYRRFSKDAVQILREGEWIPVKFRTIRVETPSAFSGRPRAWYSIVLPSGRVSTSQIATISIDQIRNGEIRVAPQTDA